VYEFGIPVGILLAPGSSDKKVAFSAGMEIRILFPI
jgi:hypothetical protein